MVTVLRRNWLESTLRTALFGCVAMNGFLLGFQVADGSCAQDDCKEVVDMGRRAMMGGAWQDKWNFSPESSSAYKMRSTSGLGGDPEQHQVATATWKVCDVFTPQCAAPWTNGAFYKGDNTNCGSPRTPQRYFCMDPQTGEGVANSWNEYEDSAH